jgi:hypothetical protein
MRCAALEPALALHAHTAFAGTFFISCTIYIRIRAEMGPDPYFRAHPDDLNVPGAAGMLVA